MDITPYTKDFSKNYLIEGKIPDICKTERCIVGIDEAGRGPVLGNLSDNTIINKAFVKLFGSLGPLVYGLCICPISKKDDLKNMSFAGLLIFYSPSNKTLQLT